MALILPPLCFFILLIAFTLFSEIPDIQYIGKLCRRTLITFVHKFLLILEGGGMLPSKIGASHTKPRGG